MPLLIPAGNPSAWTGPTGNNTYLLTGRVPGNAITSRQSDWRYRAGLSRPC